MSKYIVEWEYFSAVAFYSLIRKDFSTYAEAILTYAERGPKQAVKFYEDGKLIMESKGGPRVSW